MILPIAGVLTSEQLAGMRSLLLAPEAPWVDGRVSAGHQGALVKNNRQIDESSALAHQLGETILSALGRNPLFISAVLPRRVYPPAFNSYQTGMSFGTHVDGAIRTIPGTSQKMRTDVSATLFLSPAGSYDGGELVIDNPNQRQTIKLEAGDLLLYPTTSLHQVTPVTRGTRLASFFWIESLVPDEIRRDELFALDRSIQKLTLAGADPEAMVELAGHYHNLLRLWAQT